VPVSSNVSEFVPRFSVMIAAVFAGFMKTRSLTAALAFSATVYAVLLVNHAMSDGPGASPVLPAFVVQAVVVCQKSLPFVQTKVAA